MSNIIDIEKEQLASELRGSFLKFCQYFFEHVTKREFIVSAPTSRESHHITIARALTDAFRVLKPARGLIINVPPGHGKTVLCCLFIAWSYTHYDDCNFLYISYSHSLSAKQTAFVKQIMQSRMYRYLFEVELSADTRAKDFFSTAAGGSVAAFGSAGSITGTSAGLPKLKRFTGCVIIDDPVKPDDAHSDTIRNRVLKNYQETISQRPRDVNVPIIFIGQRLHEDDLASFLLSGEDVRTWDSVILKSIDDAGNALYPEVNTIEYLEEVREKMPYVFASQHQQDPVPAGGALFKPEWFIALDEEPELITTFITADTAETSKTWNDATVFSFWGVYEIEEFGFKTGKLGLHWLDTHEIRVEPKDLQNEFLSFYQDCMRHKMPPVVAAIEKKSTGVTLVSALSEMRSIQIRDIDRNRASGSKTQRFIEIQPYVAGKQVSYTSGARHISSCIEHMSKITANSTHRHDDVCFAKGTLIATKFGYKQIQDINVGDIVITPFGLRKVLNCGLTKRKAEVISKFGLTATPNHKIFSGDNFYAIDTLSDADKIGIFCMKELVEWRLRKLLFSMESNIGLWGREGIISLSQKATRVERALKVCMLRFGNFIANREFQKAISFIIKTATVLITTMTILSVFRISNICLSIRSKNKNTQSQKKEWRILKRLKKQQDCGIKVKREKLGILKTLKNALIRFFTKEWRFAPNAAKISLIETQGELNFARTHAMADLEEGTCRSSITNASHAGQILVEKNQRLKTKPQNIAQENAIQRDVYNLTVEEDGVYYANNILVSNCDTLADAVKISLIDKSLANITSNKNAKVDSLKEQAISRSLQRRRASIL